MAQARSTAGTRIERGGAGLRIRSVIFFALLSLVCSSCGEGHPELPHQDLARGEARTLGAREPAPSIASYTLFARLDEKRHRIHGEATIIYSNASTAPTTELYFHLYLNAFENEKTLFLRNRGGRSGEKRGHPGWIKVTSLRSSAFEGVELWELADKHSPDDPKDRTDIRVRLPKPVDPHTKLTLRLKFESQLPEIVERTGFYEDFHLVGQWFPKLAKRNLDGSWEHFPFHPFAEFYADFGDYDVTLDVPREYRVGSTGDFVSKETSGSRTRYRALAPSVHDFAWTAWPHFSESERTIEGTRVRLLTPPGSEALKEISFRTAEAGFRHLNRAYGDYPYASLTIVQPPFGALRAGGMEYPGFITTRGTELSARSWVRDQELVTIHEMAHLWFQGTVATNEAASPFLDEGLASYAEWRFLEEEFSDGSLLDFPGMQISRTAAGRFYHFSSPRDQPIALPANQFASFSALGSLVYARSSLCLATLARVYSESGLHTALRHYAEKWQFSHPTPVDFFSSLEDVMGSDVRGVAEEMFQRRSSIDLSIGAPKTVKTSAGLQSEIVVIKHGSLNLPFLVAIELDSGVVLQRSFAGISKQESFLIEHDAPIARVLIDPERKILLDENLLNNEYRAKRESRIQEGQTAVSLASWLLLAGAL